MYLFIFKTFWLLVKGLLRSLKSRDKKITGNFVTLSSYWSYFSYLFFFNKISVAGNEILENEV